MTFNSYQYAIFLPLVSLIYYFLPGNILRKYVLVLSSYIFYISYDPKLIIVLIGETLISYVAALKIDKIKERPRLRKVIFIISVILCLAALFVFKYFNFFSASIVDLINLLAGTEWVSFELNILLPVGLSFFTFQALSYLVDVYKGKTAVERSLLNYATYISFFPTLLAGPIERKDHFVSQIEKKRKISLENLELGCSLILWGVFKKIVIADKLCVLVDEVYNNLGNYSGCMILLATFAFTIQIYCDFSGYSEIAIGSAKILGIDLIENFDVPYFAYSVKGFWRRWHISLSSWFRDYIYIPLGGSRVSKFRTNINLIITFLVSGLWHGANWTYVLWGGIHGVIQIIESYIFKKEEPTGNVKRIRTLLTFLAVSFAWIFFRANSIHDAGYVITSFLNLDIGKFSSEYVTLSQAGIDKFYIFSIFVACIILLINDWIKYRKSNYWFNEKLESISFVVHFVFIFAIILLFGSYGPMYEAASFIYFKF